MQKVLINCKSIDDARFLKNYIEAELPYQVVLTMDPKDIAGTIKSQNIHLLLLQTGELAKSDIAYAMQFRQTGFQYPILMITDSVGDLAIDILSDRQKIYFLERPFELKTFKGLTRKLMVSKTVPQQIYRRYRTNITATMETFVTGERYHTHMFNLSRGGAYFELTQKPQVGIGDLLRLKVSLADMERQHHIHGRIVWTTHKGHAAGGYGVGVKFMKSSDIYRNLLEKV